MAARSSYVSLALLVLPTLLLVSFRLLSPEFSEALSNDIIIESLAHALALGVGLFAILRYRLVEDHEYHRARAIVRLSRTYRQEDRGLWEKGESAIERLEARAYSDFKGRGAAVARQRMQSSIGEIHRESIEVEQTEEEQSSFSIIVDGVEQSAEQSEDVSENKGSLISRWSNKLSDAIERTASRRTERSKKEKEEEIEVGNGKAPPSIGSQWMVPEEPASSKPTRICSDCGIYNYPSADYCTSCGSYIG